ncbi:hypothetical protein GCK32_008027, partial [Trichostrongylus colubriformis]
HFCRHHCVYTMICVHLLEHLAMDRQRRTILLYLVVTVARIDTILASLLRVRRDQKALIWTMTNGRRSCNGWTHASRCYHPTMTK